jgi:hypothetical protein
MVRWMFDFRSVVSNRRNGHRVRTHGRGNVFRCCLLIFVRPGVRQCQGPGVHRWGLVGCTCRRFDIDTIHLHRTVVWPVGLPPATQASGTWPRMGMQHTGPINPNPSDPLNLTLKQKAGKDHFPQVASTLMKRSTTSGLAASIVGWNGGLR